MCPYLCGPDRLERDFVAALRARGFKRSAPRSTLEKNGVRVGYISEKAFIFGWGRGWQSFDAVLAVLDEPAGR